MSDVGCRMSDVGCRMSDDRCPARTQSRSFLNLKLFFSLRKSPYAHIVGLRSQRGPAGDGVLISKEGKTVCSQVRHSLCAYFQSPLLYDYTMGVIESKALAHAQQFRDYFVLDTVFDP